MNFPNDKLPNNNPSYYFQKEEIVSKLAAELKDLIKLVVLSEGYTRDDFTSKKIKNIDKMLNKISNFDSTKKWNKFFKILDDLNITQDEAYSFMTYFDACKRLGLINGEQRDNLLHSYLNKYDLLD